MSGFDPANSKPLISFRILYGINLLSELYFSKSSSVPSKYFLLNTFSKRAFAKTTFTFSKVY
jgi:hypothetical protein